MSDNLPHCPDCGYTEQDASIHMDHYRCEARGGAIPRIRWQDHVELQRRMDAVRAYCTQVQAAHPVPDPCAVVYDILALLDGDGEAGE